MYENGQSGTYSLRGLFDADMLELASIIAKHDIWNQTSSNTGEYIEGGNAPSNHYFFAIKVQKEGEDPLLFTYSNKNDVPKECLAFYEEVVETYYTFDN